MIGMVFLLAANSLEAGETRPLDTCVPRDAMAVFFGRPSPEMIASPKGGMVEQLAGWIITLKAMGVIPQQGRVLADIVGSLPLLSRRPHALMLLDVTSKKIGEDAYRLNTMQSALVVDEQDAAMEIERRIRDLLATYTDATNGRIDTLQSNGLRSYQLHDGRLPDWAVVEWGTIDHQFVLAFGQGAFSKVLDTLQRRSASLTDDAWYSQAHLQCHGATSGIELYLNLERIEKCVGEVAIRRYQQVLKEFGLEDAERLLWTVGFAERALHSEAVSKTTTGHDRYLMLTGPPINAPEVTAAIPPQATRYAAFRLPLGAAFRNAKDVYLQNQSPGKRETLHKLWADLEVGLGFNLERDLIDRLGRDLVFHNWPPHPLHIPLLCTIWVGYTGDRASMTVKLDRTMQATEQLMSNPVVQSRVAVGWVPRLVRGTDGIWYLQLGLIGPAIGVADGWIVISYSGEAVRENLALLDLRSAASKSATTQASQPTP